jgi:hypothetical protein
MNIDWSKAPKDATHYAPAFGKSDELWAKKVGAYWNYFAIDDFHGRGWYAGIGPDSRESYIERPSAWHGEGLPPVGTVCEFYADEDDWRRCEIVAHRNEMAVVWVNASHIFSSQGGILRPIRTPEQIAAEERERARDFALNTMTGEGWTAGETEEQWQFRLKIVSEMLDMGYRKKVTP